MSGPSANFKEFHFNFANTSIVFCLIDFDFESLCDQFFKSSRVLKRKLIVPHWVQIELRF